MKKTLLLSMLVVSGMMISSSSEAQVRVGAQININSQPDWGPSGYNYAQYYYLPDANVYYDVVARQYIYQERGRWVNVRVLPPSMRNIDLYRSYKVVINERNPWARNDFYRKQYVNMRSRPQQMSWRDSRDKRYSREVVKNDSRGGYDDHNYRGTPNDRSQRNDRRY